VTNPWDTDYRDPDDLAAAARSRAARPGLYPTWRAALPALLVALVAVALWAGGGWLVARLVEAIVALRWLGGH
jgi:hypothetical protein